MRSASRFIITVLSHCPPFRFQIRVDGLIKQLGVYY